MLGFSFPYRFWRVFKKLHKPQWDHWIPRVPREVPTQLGLHLYHPGQTQDGDSPAISDLWPGVWPLAGGRGRLQIRLAGHLGRHSARWVMSLSQGASVDSPIVPVTGFSKNSKREPRLQSSLGFVYDPRWLSFLILHQGWFQRNCRKAVCFLGDICLKKARKRLSRYLDEDEKN